MTDWSIEISCFSSGNSDEALLLKLSNDFSILHSLMKSPLAYIVWFVKVSFSVNNHIASAFLPTKTLIYLVQAFNHDIS